jgi:hypothetical protein
MLGRQRKKEIERERERHSGRERKDRPHRIMADH